MPSSSLRPTPLAAALLVAAIAACGDGGSGGRAAAVAPSTRRPPAREAPKMGEVVPTALAPDLAALGIDARHLPTFESLSPSQIEGLMPTFARSLGIPCVGCHVEGDAKAPTRMKRISARMWNELARRYTFKGGGGLYCDSCHRGQIALLERSDKPRIAEWMSAQFTDKLESSEATPKEIECESCHGEPAEPLFLAKW